MMFASMRGNRESQNRRPDPGFDLSIFNAKYIGEWVKNGFRYSDDMDLEKKAYHVEELLNVSIPQRFGDDPCKSFRH
jgi:hypothetical protein